MDSGDIIWQGKHTIGVLDQHAQVPISITVFEYLKQSYQSLFDMEKRANELFKQSALDEQNSQKLIEKGCNLLDELSNKGFYELEGKIKKVAKGLGFDGEMLNREIATLSGGQRAKLILCKLLLDEPDLMILDEPTNHLDINNIEWLKEYLANYKKAFVTVSHDSAFLDSVCNVIWSVEFGGITRYTGNYSQFIRLHDQNLETYNKNYEKQQEKIKKLEDYIARNSARASTARQAQSRKKALEKMEVIEKLEDPPIPQLKFAYKFAPNDVAILAQDLSIGYTQPLQKNITFTLRFGDKLLVSGFNGIGKTTFLRTIIGEIEKLAGDVRIAKNAQIGYMQQNLDWENKDLTPIEYLQEKYPKLDNKQIRGYLAKVGLTSKHASLPIQRLSGGEQTKLKLVDLIINPHNILILDEPNNHLDINSKQALSKAIKNFEGACIVVSHEKNFNKMLDFDEIKFS